MSSVFLKEKLVAKIPIINKEVGIPLIRPEWAIKILFGCSSLLWASLTILAIDINRSGGYYSEEGTWTLFALFVLSSAISAFFPTDLITPEDS